MSAPNGQEPIGPGSPLGLGHVWLPGPVAWTFRKARDSSSGGTVHIMILDTPIGKIAFAFSDEAMTSFANDAMREATGLIVPPGPV
jgi:hypothetical protein